MRTANTNKTAVVTRRDLSSRPQWWKKNINRQSQLLGGPGQGRWRRRRKKHRFPSPASPHAGTKYSVPGNPSLRQVVANMQACTASRPQIFLRPQSCLVMPEAIVEKAFRLYGLMFAASMSRYLAFDFYLLSFCIEFCAASRKAAQNSKTKEEHNQHIRSDKCVEYDFHRRWFSW